MEEPFWGHAVEWWGGQIWGADLGSSSCGVLHGVECWPLGSWVASGASHQNGSSKQKGGEQEGKMN